ncbi:MAG: HEAT repeat domain-containing protein [Candidatus Hodarchaeales archaeon]
MFYYPKDATNLKVDKRIFLKTLNDNNDQKNFDSSVFLEMIIKLKEDPDKYERMFAAQYLAKYNYVKSKNILLEAISTEPDNEVINTIKKHIKLAEERLSK